MLMVNAGLMHSMFHSIDEEMGRVLDILEVKNRFQNMYNTCNFARDSKLWLLRVLQVYFLTTNDHRIISLGTRQPKYAHQVVV